MRVLVLNSGSSSIRYKLFAMEAETVIAGGHLAYEAGGKTGHDEALRGVFDALAAEGGVDAIGHRVVHGGAAFSGAAVVDDAIRAAIADAAILAPLHNPANLKGIDAARRRYPRTPQVAVFDTAFHRTIPPVAATYPLSPELAGRHAIRRYGFHGTSCAWSLAAVAGFLGRSADSLNLIVAHLGAGASVTAIRDGRSVDTSMGFSPLEGLMMQTRAGDLDPGILVALSRSGMDADDLDGLLNRASGVKAIAGEADMRTVARRAAAGDADAAFAREMYAYRVAKYVGAYAGIVWPLDALVFTGGVGENDSGIRTAISDGVPQLGLNLDPARNAESPTEPVRSRRSGTTGPDIFVVRANEELQIARETVTALALMSGRG